MKLGMVFEGGANRTVFSCGVMDKFLEENIMPDYYIGVSAGMAYGLSYLSGQKGRNLELMEKYPNLKMIAGMNEYSSVGAARAVKAAGAKERIQVVGVDSSQEAVQLMENGVFKGLVVQKAFKMGYMGVKETVRMLRGKSYDKDVNSGCELVTPDNMYSSEIEKLLFPFNTLRLS